MEKTITIKELREQLQSFENLGMGNAIVMFRDWNDVDHKVENGIYDVCENKIILG